MPSLLGEDSSDAEVPPAKPPRLMPARGASLPVEVEKDSSSEVESIHERRIDLAAEASCPAGDVGASPYALYMGELFSL